MSKVLPLHVHVGRVHGNTTFRDAYKSCPRRDGPGGGIGPGVFRPLFFWQLSVAIESLERYDLGVPNVYPTYVLVPVTSRAYLIAGSNAGGDAFSHPYVR